MPSIDATFNSLFAAQPDDYHRARLTAVKAPHSGDWLNVLPISSCGLRTEDNAIRVVVGFRLGASLCEPHQCTCGITWLIREVIMACHVKGVLGEL